MDRYIKSKKKAIKSVRKTILFKYEYTFFSLIIIIIFLLARAINQPPEKWKHTEIVFSNISHTSGTHRSTYLNSQNGEQFHIITRYVSREYLEKNLVPGKIYSLVYSNTIAGGNHMKALYDEKTIYQDLNNSISQWENEQKEYVVSIIVIIVIEFIALILIDRLWCKEEYAQIKKLKEKIKRQEDRLKKKRLTSVKNEPILK